MVWRFICALSAAWLGLAVSSVQAADMAEYNVLGYSQDGRFFAFEQFGIQDGSGFAYADIFIIDVQDDRWVGGSPFRVQADDEVVPLLAIRAEALADASPQLNSRAITVPARVLAATTPMEVGDQEDELTFYRRPIRNPIDPPATLVVETFPLASPRDCYGMVETAGFAVKLQVLGYPQQVIHRDTRLPSSRACPADYGVAAIVVPFDGAPGRAVALVSMYQLGFEGLDRRFLAIPFDLPI